MGQKYRLEYSDSQNQSKDDRGEPSFCSSPDIAKYNRRGDVVMQCHRRWAREGKMWIVTVLKGTLGVHALNYVTSLVIVRVA